MLSPLLSPIPSSRHRATSLLAGARFSGGTCRLGHQCGKYSATEAPVKVTQLPTSQCPDGVGPSAERRLRASAYHAGGPRPPLGDRCSVLLTTHKVGSEHERHRHGWSFGSPQLSKPSSARAGGRCFRIMGRLRAFVGAGAILAARCQHLGQYAEIARISSK